MFFFIMSSSLFSCLVNFNGMPDIVNFTLWGVRYVGIFIDILQIYSEMQLTDLETV